MEFGFGLVKGSLLFDLFAKHTLKYETALEKLFFAYMRTLFLKLCDAAWQDQTPTCIKVNAHWVFDLCL